MRKAKKDKCFLIPVGGESLDFIRVRAARKPNAKTVKALRDLAKAARVALAK